MMKLAYAGVAIIGHVLLATIVTTPIPNSGLWASYFLLDNNRGNFNAN